MRARKLQRTGSYPHKDAFAEAKRKNTVRARSNPPRHPPAMGLAFSSPTSRVSVSMPRREAQVASVSISALPCKPSRFPSAERLISRGKLVQVLTCLAKEKIVLFKHHQPKLPADLHEFNGALQVTRKGERKGPAFLSPASRHTISRSLALWCSQFWALLVELQSLCHQRCTENPLAFEAGGKKSKTSFAWLLEAQGLGSDIRSALVSALPFSFVIDKDVSSSDSSTRVFSCELCGPGESLPNGTVCIQPCQRHSFCAECLVRALPSTKVDFSPSSRLLHSSPCVLFFCPLCTRERSQKVTRENALLSFCLMLWLCEKLAHPESLPGLPLQELHRTDLVAAFGKQQRMFGSKKWIASQTSASLHVLVDEAVLTSTCPSCRKRCVNPLVDPSHSDCLVVTCEACEHQFCGWCHFDLGTSRGQGREYEHTLTLIQHHHVKQCFWNPDKNNLYISAMHRKQCEAMLRAFAHRLVKDKILASRPDLQQSYDQDHRQSISGKGNKRPEHWSCLWCENKNSNSSGVCLGCNHNLFPWFLSRLKYLLNL